MNYRDLEIWKLAKEAAIGVHRMTLQELPKFEMYEEATFRDLQGQLDLLGRKLNVFIEGVEREHIPHPASRIPHPAS